MVYIYCGTMQASLSGKASIQLLACVAPGAQDCLHTLRAGATFSQAQTGASPEAYQPTTMVPSEVSLLETEVSRLQEELEHAHGHYQKLLEQAHGAGATQAFQGMRPYA